MDLKNLTTFIYVAELSSFTKAAAYLGYTQSTVSFQIKQLETELGVPLFERIHHTVTLTDPGRKLLQAAHDINKLLNDFAEDEGKQETGGQVRLAMADSLCSSIVSKFFPKLREKCPGVTLNVMTAGTGELFRLLNHNEADLVYTLDSHIYNRNYLILREERVDIHFVAAATHPLCHENSLSVRQLLEQPFILTEKGMSYRKILDEKLASMSLGLDPVLEIGNADLICKLVAQGAGISFLPDYATRQAAAEGKLAYLPVTDMDIEIWAQLLMHRDKWFSDPIRMVVELLEIFGI